MEDNNNAQYARKLDIQKTNVSIIKRTRQTEIKTTTTETIRTAIQPKNQSAPTAKSWAI